MSRHEHINYLANLSKVITFSEEILQNRHLVKVSKNFQQQINKLKEEFVKEILLLDDSKLAVIDLVEKKEDKVKSRNIKDIAKESEVSKKDTPPVITSKGIDPEVEEAVARARLEKKNAKK